MANRRSAVSLALFILGSGLLSCAASLSTAAKGVTVIRRSEGYGASAAPLPSGCRLVGAHAAVDRTELELATTDHSRERERAAAAGANLLIARAEMTIPRRDYDCPAASPITDCPPSEGAWFRVVYEDYACSPEALDELRPPSR
jgi:hypothetical protein